MVRVAKVAVAAGKYCRTLKQRVGVHFHFWGAGETEGRYKGEAFTRYWYAYDADPARRSILCTRPTSGARCTPCDSNHPIRTLVCSPCLRTHVTKDTRADRGGLGIMFAMDTAHG